MDAEALRFKRLNTSVQLCSLTLLCYDYLITILDEIEYIWRNPWKLTTVFYVFCRYSLIANPLYLLAVSKDVSLQCNTGYMISGVLSIFGHTGILAVWGLRTSAICNRNKIITAFLGMIGLAILVLLIVRAPFNQCRGPVRFQWLRGVIAALMLFYEVLAFFLAAYRAWRTVREDVRLWNNPKMSLNYVIFSQGLIYISAVFALSVFALALNFRVNLLVARLLNSLKLPLSGFLTARFIIQLKKWERRKVDFDFQDTLPSFHVHTSRMPDFRRDWDSIDDAGSPGMKPTLKNKTAIEELGGDIGPNPLSLLDPIARLSNGDDNDVEPTRERDSTGMEGRPNMLSVARESLPSAMIISPLSSANLRNRAGAQLDKEENGWNPTPRLESRVERRNGKRPDISPRLHRLE